MVALLALCGTLFVISEQPGQDRAGPPYPSEWDPEILPYASFVATERGMLFKHPVYVDYLEKESFVDSVAPQAELTDAEILDNRRYSEFYRAIGLVTGEFNLYQTQDDLQGDAVLGYYDPETQRITLRGSVLSPEVRVTLVHELTHALQDQYFNLGELQDTISEEQYEAYRALVEGDASRIDSIYFDEQLTFDEQEEIYNSYEDESTGNVYAGYPRALVSFLTAPYSLGEPMTNLLYEFGGQQALDDAIIDPPADSEILLDPLAHLFGKPSEVVPPPPLADGEVAVEGFTFGPLAWYVVLEQRLGAKAALIAVQGWGGDSYVMFERGTTVCLRSSIRGDDPESMAIMAGAFQAWAAAMPAGAASVTVGDLLQVDACDPGVDAVFSPGPDEVLDALALPAARSHLALTLVEDGYPKEYADCATRVLVAESPLEFWTPAAVDPALVEQLWATADQRCGG